MQGYEELENGTQSALQPMSCMQPKQKHFFLHRLQVQHPRKSISIKYKENVCILGENKQNNNMEILNRERN